MSENLQADVVILGGGLAGLCLALQLRQRFADLAIVVLERNVHPLPIAAHKVGESKVRLVPTIWPTPLACASTSMPRISASSASASSGARAARTWKA